MTALGAKRDGIGIVTNHFTSVSTGKAWGARSISFNGQDIVKMYSANPTWPLSYESRSDGTLQGSILDSNYSTPG
jgi:hypothetical protein